MDSAETGTIRRDERSSVFRQLTPVTLSAVWIASFFGIIVGALFLPLLVPHHAAPILVALGVGVLAIVALMFTAAKRLSNEQLYSFFRAIGFLGVLVYVPVFLLTPSGASLLLIAIMGMPTIASHYLRSRDLVRLLILTNIVTIAAFALQVTQHRNPEFAALLVATIPLTWVLSWMTFIQNDIRINAIRKAKAQSFDDPLTGLVSRRGLVEAADEMLEGRSINEHGGVALLLIDIDNFKNANTLYGHRGGDYVLRVVANALKRAASTDHVIARAGGDEFVVLMPRASDAMLGPNADRFRNAIQSGNREIELEGVNVDASVGFAISPRDGSTLDELLAAADERLYEQKTSRGASRADAKLDEHQDVRPMPDVTEPVSVDRRDASLHAPKFGRMFRASEGGLLASAIVLASLPLLPSAHTYPIPAAAMAAAVFIFAAWCFFFPLELGPRASSLLSVVAYALVGALAFCTNGTNGPAFPLVLLLLAHDAWSSTPRAMIGRFLLAELVIFSPLLYQVNASPTATQAMYGTIAAAAVMVAVITLLMVHNRRLMAMVRERSQHLASHDQLTAVLNRRAFEAAVEAELETGEPFAIVMIDLDNFKDVNTDHGHVAGDRVLADVGSSLHKVARRGDVVGRVGGDEFAALLRNANGADAKLIAERFVAVVNGVEARLSVAGGEHVTASCGVALFPQHGRSYEDLLVAADEALMYVKTAGKASAHVHNLQASA